VRCKQPGSPPTNSIFLLSPPILPNIFPLQLHPWCKTALVVFQQLSSISQHTLVIYGCNDVLIPHPVIHPDQKTAEIARAGCRQLHNGYLNFIDACGHFLQFEKPDETNRLIRAFMQ
jgi:pimeloyl-ACP methyl ester carboxylesterase